MAVSPTATFLMLALKLLDPHSDPACTRTSPASSVSTTSSALIDPGEYSRTSLRRLRVSERMPSTIWLRFASIFSCR